MYELIQTASVKFPPAPEITDDAKDFILKLLVRDTKKRLGSVNDFEDIKKHSWFKDIDWDKLYNKKITPPFKPKVSGDNWMDNFDQEFVQEGNFINNIALFISYSFSILYRGYQLIRWNQSGIAKSVPKGIQQNVN